VDKANGRLTVRHGPIQSLDMPAMTMVFRVADPGLLDRVNVGDKIRFQAEKRDGALVITELKRPGE
jgi:Cu/Ag efflux protein CusF